MDAIKGKLKKVIDPALAKAFTHPLRGHVLVTLCEKGVASPKEIADEIGLEVSEVSYHFRELKRRKLIRLVRTEKRRGFSEHFYEPVVPALHFDDEEWMSIPRALRSTFSADMLRHIIDDLVAALEGGTLDARNRHLSRTPMTVDEQGWDEATRVVDDALGRILAIQKACAERQRTSPGGQIRMCVVMTSFESG